MQLQIIIEFGIDFIIHNAILFVHTDYTFKAHRLCQNICESRILFNKSFFNEYISIN